MWALQSPQTPQLLRSPYHTNSIAHLPPKPSSVCCCVSLNSSTTPTSLSSRNKNELIQSLCKQGNLKQALDVLSSEPNPTQHTYELLLLSCAHHNSLSDALNVHCHLTDNGFDQDPFLVTKLINVYSHFDSVDDARHVFDKTRRRTIYVWNALFRALTLAGRGEEVLELYRRMNGTGTGIRSDRFTYTYVLKACVASSCGFSLLKHGKEIHASVLRHGYNGIVHIMTTLIDMYARFGCVMYAGFVFSQMAVKNVVSWSAMIACYARNGMAFEALELFREMIMESHDLCPNSVTMVSVLQACAALAALEQGKMIHGYILRRGLDSILPVSTGRCMADICGALHCDLMLEPMIRKTKCNPAAAARNRHLCESLANSCFPVNEGPSASRLHEFFLRQFCDAHTCTGKQKPLSKGHRKRTSMTYVTISILILMLLPLFYGFVYLYQRGIKRGAQELKRISQGGRKKKPY